MIDYINLKNNYIAAVQMGFELGLPNPKQGNDLLHNFCKNLIDNSNYSESDKQKMKNELDDVKEMLSIEIEHRFHNAE